MSYTPSNLIEAVRYFSDLRVCNEYMKAIKWGGGVPCCPECGSVSVYELSTRPVLKCRDCKKQFSYKVGTIFEDSPLGLDKWFVAKGLVNVRTPTLDEVAASLAASVFLLKPDELRKLHAAIDDVANSPAGEKEFKEASRKLTDALRVGQDREVKFVEEFFNRTS